MGAGVTHELSPSLATLHGRFSRDLPPALFVEPGDVVRMHTLDVTWGLENHRGIGLERPRMHRPAGEERYDGPALLGPIAVRGARPGMVLRIDILEAALGPWGWTYAGGPGALNGAVNRALGIADAPPAMLLWEIDRGRGVATDAQGRRVRVRAFPGTIGVAPGEPGLHSGWHPRRTGGNMDCRELGAGSTLYLPVEAEGALLSAGDGHAAQGDGEAGGTAIECRLEPLTLRLWLEDGPPISGPRVRTADSWVTLGFGPTLEEAAHMALGGAIDLLCSRLGVDRVTAAALAGVVVDLRITQMVNGTVGVHAVLADAALA
ncbi:MAG TPA: acetamidase/formamidase family protein [Phycisphaerales bacterium]|nr:acetamidase/formamidase family protein [Phycisphaerales bacterium]